MPISSTEVSNIIAAQLASFSASAQYARSIAASGGFADAPGDPRDPSIAAAQAGSQAGMIGSAAVRAPDLALSAIGGAAMLGMGPRIADPFSASFSAATLGYRGAGISGGLGMGLGVFGGYMAAGAALGWATNQMAEGAQMRGASNAMIGGAIPHATAPQLNNLSAAMEGMARAGHGSMGELTALMGQGIAGGDLDTGNVAKFQASFSSLVSRVRQVATTLNSSLTEAYSALEVVRSLGVSESGAAGIAGMIHGVAGATGMSRGQILTAAGAGASFGRSAGIDPDASARGAIVSTGAYGIALKDKIPGVSAESYGEYAQGAARFLSTSRGRHVLGALMNEHGSLDQDAVAELTSGAMTRQEIMRRYHRTVATSRGRDLLDSRGDELTASLITQYGPESLAPVIRTMAEGTPRPESFITAATGLTREGFSGMMNMHSASSTLRSRLASSMSDSLGGQPQQLSVLDTLGQSVDILAQPMKERLHAFAADITGAVQEATETLARQFVAAPPRRADPRAYAEYFRASIMNEIPKIAAAAAAGRESGFQITSPGPSIADGLPGILSINNQGPGTSPRVLPMFGMATGRYNPWLSVGAAGMGANIMGRAGSSMLGWGMERLGGMGGIAKGTFSDFGIARGTGRLVGAGAAATGGLMSIAGGALRSGGGIASLADLTTNLGPGVLRELGLMSHSEGAIRGANADLLRYADAAGLPGLFRRSGLTSTQVREEGYTPVAGDYEDGTQLFLSGAEKDRSMLAETLVKARSAGSSLLGQDKYRKLLGDTTGADDLIAAATRAGASKSQAFAMAFAARRIPWGSIGDTTNEDPKKILDDTISRLESSAGEKGTPSSVSSTLSALAKHLRDHGVGGSLSIAQVAGMSGESPELRKALMMAVGDRLGSGAGFAVDDTLKYLRGSVGGGTDSGVASFLGRAGMADSMRGAVLYHEKYKASVLSTEREDRTRMARLAASVGIGADESDEVLQQLFDGVSMPLGSEGEHAGTPVKARKMFLDLLDSRKVSAAARSRLAGKMMASGSVGLRDLGIAAGLSSRFAGAIETYGKKGKDPRKLLSGILGRDITLSKEDSLYLRGKSDDLSNELREQLVDATHDYLRSTLGDQVTSGEAGEHAAALLEGVRRSVSSGDSSTLKKAARELASMSLPGGPTSEKPEAVPDATAKLVRSMDELTRKFEALAGSISLFTS